MLNVRIVAGDPLVPLGHVARRNGGGISLSLNGRTDDVLDHARSNDLMHGHGVVLTSLVGRGQVRRVRVVLDEEHARVTSENGASWGYRSVDVKGNNLRIDLTDVTQDDLVNAVAIVKSGELGIVR